MKADRIKVLAIQIANCTDIHQVQDHIRLALAERDREVAEWAEENGVECLIRSGEDTERMVDVSALLAFLEAQP